MIDDFCDAIHQEFFSGIIANILEENDGAIDEEALVEEVNQELRLKLCLDEETVSINALELFTRQDDKSSKDGLTRSIKKLM